MDNLCKSGTASLDALFEKLNLPLPKNESQPETNNEEGVERKGLENRSGEEKKRGRPRGKKSSLPKSEGVTKRLSLSLSEKIKRELIVLQLSKGDNCSFSDIVSELIHEKFKKTSLEFLNNLMKED